MRFDKHFVESMREVVWQHHTLGEEFDKFPEFYTVTNPGRGTGYVNIGGRTGYWGVQYGAKGARRVAAYLYGLGAASGALVQLHEQNKDDWDLFYTAVDKARADIGQEEFDAWTRVGRERVERFHEWSAKGN